MAAQFAKYKPVNLICWMAKQKARSPAIEHYLEVLTGSLALAHAEIKEIWDEEDRIAGKYAKTRSRKAGDALPFVHHITDCDVINEPFAAAIIARAIQNNPWTHGVATYMNAYVNGLDKPGTNM